MTKKRNVSENMQKTKNKDRWDKRIVIVVEVSLCIISALVFAFVPNDIAKGISSNVLTALIVTVLGTMVRWNTETEVERTLKEEEKTTAKRINEMQKAASQRISEIQKSTNDMIERLDISIDHLQDSLSTLNQSSSDFSAAIENFNGKACTFCRNIIKEVKLNRRDCNLITFFSKAQESICILATNLESFTDYLPQFKALARNKIKIRIAAIHPNFARSFNISRVTGNTSPEVRWQDMKTSLQQFVSFIPKDDEWRQFFQVRAYSRIAPTLILIMVDNDCYVANLINGKRASDTIHFRFTANGDDVFSPVKYLKQHFESIWNDEGTHECDINEISSITYENAET